MSFDEWPKKTEKKTDWKERGSGEREKKQKEEGEKEKKKEKIRKIGDARLRD